MRLRVIDPLSIGLLVLLCGGGLADFFNDRKVNKQFDKLILVNEAQAKELSAASGNLQKQAVLVNDLVGKQAQMEAKFNETLAQKDKKAGEQWGIAATQAGSIARTTPASDTVQHYNTTVGFMKQAGGVEIDQILAWNTSYVAQNQQEMEILRKLLEQEKVEKAKIAENLAKETQKSENLAKNLADKAIQHEKVAGEVQVAHTILKDKDSWIAKLKSVMFWSAVVTIIGVIGFVLYHLYHILGLRRVVRAEAERRRQANEARYEAEKHAYELKTATKTFLAVGPEGNDQMMAILNANGLKKHFEDAIVAEAPEKG